MKALYTSLLMTFAFSGFSQTPVNLNIYHKLGTADFAYNQPSQNNMMNGNFKLTRMEYYITKFTIIHDGGMITTVPSSVVAIVKANEQTSIALGSFNVTNIEGIKFHIGVHTPVNHQDPSVQPSGTPLSFQSPSMHWGWTSGYRFIALEGKTGTAMNQTTELHGLGDANYYETTVMAVGNLFNGEYFVNVDADYNRALENVNISQGVVVHGENQEAAVMIANFKNYVYSPSASLAGLTESIAENTSVYPIPSNGSLTISTPVNFIGNSIKIFDLTGKLIQEHLLVDGQNKLGISLKNKGFYILDFYQNNDKLFSKKVLNN
jgi:hypothetical protein